MPDPPDDREPTPRIAGATMRDLHLFGLYIQWLIDLETGDHEKARARLEMRDRGELAVQDIAGREAFERLKVLAVGLKVAANAEGWGLDLSGLSDWIALGISAYHPYEALVAAGDGLAANRMLIDLHRRALEDVASIQRRALRGPVSDGAKPLKKPPEPAKRKRGHPGNASLNRDIDELDARGMTASEIARALVGKYPRLRPKNVSNRLGYLRRLAGDG